MFKDNVDEDTTIYRIAGSHLPAAGRHIPGDCTAAVCLWEPQFLQIQISFSIAPDFTQVQQNPQNKLSYKSKAKN
jgi:hypothetical protein